MLLGSSVCSQVLEAPGSGAKPATPQEAASPFQIILQGEEMVDHSTSLILKTHEFLHLETAHKMTIRKGMVSQTSYF